MTTTKTYGDLLTAYLDDPSSTTLSPLRRAIRSAPGFTPDLDLDDAHRLVDEGAYDSALSQLRGLLPGALFSPSYHSLLAQIFEAIGKSDDAAREQQFARAAVTSIRSTGDGSFERPWSVLRINDEYDMLRTMDKTSARQSLLQHGERKIDRHESTDGGVFHFDATELVGR
ncbi:uncharacterized protein DUF4919 [Nocardioides albertanoniae]|uniref:Uncharacterized protein DUF4919 n=1 Tax=Nocardioides albertanoniae TaxID=1175486 RepID=A0A543A576_9ACTN|nr:DUF4919 domain-containing protein [Nocardioides albertanoniae]TQL67697.1 uncharacterized protein DUF4919 [Nocardioides albertanoniae]